MSPAGDPVLELEDLGVVYGRAVAIRGVTVRANLGEVVTIVGRNGAGKTSTMRGAAGFTRMESGRVYAGTVRCAGQDLTGKDPAFTARAGLRLVPERDKVFSKLTVAENLEVAAERRATPPGRDLVLEMFPEINAKLRQRAGYLSGGEKQMLAISMALQVLPHVLLIDELSLGLAPGLIADLMGRIRTLHDQHGVSLLIVEQNVTAVVPISQRVYVLGDGTVRREFGAGVSIEEIGAAMLDLGQVG